jgi:arginine/lysine/ornithine decarboxylase
VTTYYAAVKYAVDATDETKITALRTGLRDMAGALVEEFGVPLEDVERWLDDAYSAAEESADYVARWKARNA